MQTIFIPTHGQADALRRQLQDGVNIYMDAARRGDLSAWREDAFGKEHGRRPAVGNGVAVNPYYAGGVGNVAVAQYYPRGVGAPVEQAGQPGAPAVQPVVFSQPAYVAGGNSYFGLGLRIVPPATNTATLQTLIDTRGKLQFNVKPIRPYNPAHLYFASTVIDLTVEQVKIQGIEVFSSEEPVFIEAFSEVSRVPAIQWLTIQEATGVTMTVGNPTAVQELAKGAFHGTYLRQ